MKIIKIVVVKALILLYDIMFHFIKVNRNIIIFESNLGKNFTGNPRAIYESMVSKGYDYKYKCVWVVDSATISLPGNAVRVKRMRFRYLYYFVRAKYWIVDSRQPLFLKKKKSQMFIQTWHGTPLKKLALDMEVLDMGGETDLVTYKKRFKQSSSRWDILLSQNNYSSMIFGSAFAFNKKILEIGYPRNDFLINFSEVDKKNIKIKLKIPEGKRVLLYAPTWRDNDFSQKGKYNFNTAFNIKTLYEKLSTEYVLIVKAHYLVSESLSKFEYEDFVYTFTNDVDIKELYVISDKLITDYSSVMFDYSVLKRPMIFFAYDYEQYENNLRGFYFDMIDEVPGPIVRSSKDLIRAINMPLLKYNQLYREKYIAFNDKYNHFDDGRASSRFLNEVLLNKEEKNEFYCKN